ncbi:MAG: signal peptidase II [Candidatus Buchananbacteria bacterium]|jgi:signal peptidase II
MSDRLKTAGIISLAAVFFIADRALKRLFLTAWRQDDFKIIGNWVNLKLAGNPGIAFSLPFNRYLIILLTILALIILIYSAWLNHHRKNFYLFFAFVIVIIGAYSNLLDRTTIGSVVDYIDLKYFSILNLADIMITGGIAMILFSIFKRESNKKNRLELEG